MLSYRQNIPIILKVIEDLNPKSVLDIGAGMGKFGLLIREQYLSNKAAGGELEPVDDIVIDAVEDTEYLHKGKLGDILHAIYNRVFSNSIFEEDVGMGEYDLMLLIDVVEHWDKQVGVDLLKKLTIKSAVIVSTPQRVGMYKEHFYGDPRHHISQWDESDFINNFPNVKFCKNARSHIALIPKQQS